MLKVVKRIISRILHLAFDKHYRLIYLSGLFDREFYVEENPEVNILGVDPLLHFMRSGIDIRKRRPSLLVDLEYYCLRYPEIQEGCSDPFLHFLQIGWKENKSSNYFFDMEFYLKEYKKLISSNTNPLSHYAKNSLKRKYYPSKYFVEGSLHRRFEELFALGLDPLKEFSRIRYNNRLNIAKYFDISWYHDQLPVMPKDDLLLWQHYLDYGIHEGRNPLPLFDSSYYRGNNKDIEAHVDDLFVHYQEHETMDNRRPSPFFDPLLYLQHFPDCRSEGLTPLEHFLKVGVYQRVTADPRVNALGSTPVISIVVPVYNPAIHHLSNCIRSVLYQTYPHWQLCLCDDCSTAPHVRELLLEWQARDSRINVVFLDKNSGISAATNEAARHANGDFIGFLDNDDELTVDCLYWVVKSINENNADLIYTDEILIGDDGRDFTAFYKPDFNRLLLLSHNYITHFMVVATPLYLQIGGCDASVDGAQDFDLTLKTTEIARRIHHIPRILYRWRASASSTSINHDQKSYADEAGRMALQRSIERAGGKGWVESTDWRFFYRVRYQQVEPAPSVAIVCTVPSVSQLDLEWLQAITYQNHRIIVVVTGDDVDVGEMPGDKIDVIGRREDEKIGAQLNRAVQKANTDFLVFVQNATPQGDNWLSNLLEYGQGEDCGLAAGRLVSPSGEAPASKVANLTEDSSRYYALFLYYCSVHLNGLQWLQEVAMAPSFFSLIRRQLFLKEGGFSEDFDTELFLGADLSLRLQNRGLKNIYNPYTSAEYDVQLQISAEKNNINMSLAGEQDKKMFQKIWQKELASGNPFYNAGCYREGNISEADFISWYAGLTKKL